MSTITQMSDIFGKKRNVALPRTTLYDQGDFIVDIEGHGMEPDFPDKSIVIVSSQDKVEIGDVGIFVMNSKPLIKELGKNELICRNKNYPNIRLKKSDTVLCFGKVLGLCNKDDIVFDN